jgi:regulatory protein
MKPPKQLPPEELFSWSVKKLGMRAISIGELRTALLRRAAEASDVEAVLARLRNSGYLNDARFAESFDSSRLANVGFGQSRVIRELRRRRVAPDLAQREVSRVYAGQDELELIEQYIRRKYRSANREGLFQSDKELASAYGRLMRAGFTSGNCIRVLKRFAANPDLLDEMNLPESEEPDAE